MYCLNYIGQSIWNNCLLLRKTNTKIKSDNFKNYTPFKQCPEWPMYPLNEGAFEQTLFKIENSSRKRQICYPLTYLQEVNESYCVLNELNTKRWSPRIYENLGQIIIKYFARVCRTVVYIWNTNYRRIETLFILLLLKVEYTGTERMLL